MASSLKLALIFSLLFGVASSLSYSEKAQAEEQGGIGFVLLNTIMMRGKKSSDGSLLGCVNSFKTSPLDASNWASDLYLIELSQGGKSPTVWTRVDEIDDCRKESLKILFERHSCLANELPMVLELSKRYAEEIRQAYRNSVPYSSNQKNQTKDLAFEVVIQSTDRNVPFIDIYAWDFSWLTKWGPFYNSEQNCPFAYEFRNQLKLPDGRKTLIDSHKIDF